MELAKSLLPRLLTVTYKNLVTLAIPIPLVAILPHRQFLTHGKPYNTL